MSKSVDSSTRVVTNYTVAEAKQKEPKSFGQNVRDGTISGVVAVCLIQPLIYFKNICQTQTTSEGKMITPVKRFATDPRVWYRGIGGFAGSFAPTAAIQTAANGVLSNVLSPIIAATAAGMTSAIVVCPAEGIMIQQQKTGSGFWKTAEHIYSRYGMQGFYRGFVSTMIREGTFTAAYLGAAPMMKEKLQAYGIHPWAAQIIAGACVGIVAAGISHPFDTIKTRIQGDFSMKTPMMNAIFQKEAFAGFKWRVAMVVTATIVMPFVQEKLQKIE